MRIDTLGGLNDDELRDVISRSEQLLKERDEDRKAKAIEQARATLEAVGLSLNDLKAKRRPVSAKVYHGGRQYQHPTNRALVWKAKGKKPGWLVTLEASGGKAIEIANDEARKAG